MSMSNLVNYETQLQQYAKPFLRFTSHSLCGGRTTTAYTGQKATTRGPPIVWAGQNAAPLTFGSKPSEAALPAVLWNFDKCRREVAGDVISGMVGE